VARYLYRMQASSILCHSSSKLSRCQNTRLSCHTQNSFLCERRLPSLPFPPPPSFREQLDGRLPLQRAISGPRYGQY